MPKIHAPLFLLLFAPAASVRAQVPAQVRASISELRVITEKAGEAPDTLVMRTVTAGSRSRIEVSGPGATHLPWSMLGATMIMVGTDSTLASTYVDSVKKTYWTQDLGKTIEAITNSMHIDMAPEVAADTLQLDSLGSGGVIDGYETIHFRTHATTHLTTSMLGMTESRTEASVSDYYVAPALPPDGVDRNTPDGVHFPAQQSMTLSPGMKVFAAKEAANKARMEKIGNIVRTPVRSTTDANGTVTTLTRTTERIAHTVATVPDSLFVVPASYTRSNPAQLTFP